MSRLTCTSDDNDIGQHGITKHLTLTLRGDRYVLIIISHGYLTISLIKAELPKAAAKILQIQL